MRRIPPWSLLTAVLIAAVAVWSALERVQPYLGYDESVYANKARSWLSGDPAASWSNYRPPGVSVLGLIPLSVRGEGVSGLRLVGLALALLTLVITCLMAARMSNPRRAVVAVLVVVTGAEFLRWMPGFLNDIGSAGLLLGVVYLVVLGRTRPYALVGAAGVAVLAFYLRYGALSGLLAIAIAAIVTWGPRAWAASWRQLLLAGGVLLAGLAPHLVYSQLQRGSPLAILGAARSVARGRYPGDGLVYYISEFPLGLAGALGGAVMAAGLAGAAMAAGRASRRVSTGERPGDRVRFFVGVTAVAHAVLLGLAAHGERRFVFLPIILLTILGVDTLADLAGRWSAVILATVSVLAIVSGAVAYSSLMAEGRATASKRHAVAVVGRELAGGGGPCLVIATSSPQLGWYSRCDTTGFETGFKRYGAIGLPRDRVVHLVTFDGQERDPAPEEIKRLIGNRTATTRKIDTATVTTLAPAT